MNQGLRGFALRDRTRRRMDYAKFKVGSVGLAGLGSFSDGYLLDRNYQRAAVALFSAEGGPLVTLTTQNTWENIATGLEFDSLPNRDYLAELAIAWRPTTAGNHQQQTRLVIDGDTTLSAQWIHPDDAPMAALAAGFTSTASSMVSGPIPFVISGMPGGPHTIAIQNHDQNTGVDRHIIQYQLLLREL